MSLLLAAALVATPIPVQKPFIKPFNPPKGIAANIKIRGVTLDDTKTPVEYEVITCRAEEKSIFTLSSDGIFDFTFHPSNIIAPEGGLQPGHCAFQDRPMSAEQVSGFARINLYMSGIEPFSTIYTPQSPTVSGKRMRYRFEQNPNWLLKFTTTLDMVQFRVYKEKDSNIFVGYHD